MSGLYFYSTSQIIKYVEGLIDAQISVTCDVDIDSKHPMLFCANHFTRMETFLMPSALYKNLDLEIRSLGDAGLFIGPLGDYLKEMGTISTRDPRRNEIILSNLMTAKSNWIIYPEGRMMKNKKVTKGEGHFILHEPDGERAAHTGAAVLALKSELEKSRFLNLQKACDLDGVKEFRQKYELSIDDEVTYYNTQIIPVTITYTPIRPGDNALLQLADSVVEEVTDQILEELEIEGNLLLSAQTHIHIGHPIDVRKFIQEAKRELKVLQEGPITDDAIIEMCRHPLTTLMLDQIYRSTLITFDHIFALILEYCPTNKLSVRAVKAAIYVITKEIIGLRIYKLHKTLNYNLYKLLINEPFKAFDSVMELAISQGVLVQENDDIYIIERDIFNNEHDFYTIRIKNTLRVLINEVALLEDLRECVKKEVNKPAHIVKKEAFYIIYNRDEKFFSNDYKQFYSVFYSKSKDVGKPFILYDPSFTTGMVISHGYKAAPKEISLLAEFVHKLKINVYAVRLKGHGTTAENLKEVHYEDWIDSFNQGFAAMRQISQKLLLCGFSMGGLLAFILASRKEKHVDGIISINSALALNDIRINFIPTVNVINNFLALLNADLDYIEDAPEHPEINYAKHYVHSVGELKKVMDLCKKSLLDIEAPTLIIQGDNDPVVNPKSADLIFSTIKSKKKKKIMIKSSVHVIVQAPEREEVFEAVRQFVLEC